MLPNSRRAARAVPARSPGSPPVAAEGAATDEQGASRFVPHAVISERLSPLAIGLLALRGGRRPAAPNRLQGVELIQPRVRAQLETAKRHTLGQSRTRVLHERQQLGQPI